MRYRISLVLGTMVVAPPVLAQTAASGSPITAIYFVRHAAIDPTDSTFPLNALGRAQANVFARTVRDVRFTHVFSSHTTRARQMVERVALERNLPVTQLPVPGSRLDTLTVSDRTSSRVAIAPLVAALRGLPAGSSALVGVNSDNIYALLNGLGVPVATATRPCPPGSTCVPCLSNACFPGGEDQLWVLVIHPGATPHLIELRYGVNDR